MSIKTTETVVLLSSAPTKSVYRISDNTLLSSQVFPPLTITNSSMLDTVGGSDRRMRPCVHVKTQHFYKSGFLQYGDSAEGVMEEVFGGTKPSNGAYWDTNWVTLAQNPRDPQPNNLVVPTAGLIEYLSTTALVDPPSALEEIKKQDWRHLQGEAFKSIRERIVVKDSSIVNFLLEFGDFVQLYNQFKQGRKRILDALNVSKNAKFERRRQDAGYTDKQRVKDAARNVGYDFSTAWLTWQLALKPMVSDLQNISASLNNLQERLEAMQKASRKRNIMHYQKDLDLSTLESRKLAYVENRGNWGYCPLRLWRTTRVTELKFVQTVHYRVVWKQLDGTLTRIRQMLASFGVDNIASIVWEAVPFSFVVDYFVDIGGAIDYLFKGGIEPYEIVIEEACASIKCKTSTVVDTFFELGYFPKALERQQTAYVRKVDFPPTFIVPRLRLPSLHALITISALFSAFGGLAEPPKWKPAAKYLNFNASTKKSYWYKRRYWKRRA